MLQPHGVAKNGHNWVTEQNHQDKTARKGSSYQNMETDSLWKWSPEVLQLWLKKAVSTGDVTEMDPRKSIPAPHFLQVSLSCQFLAQATRKITHWCNLTNSSPKAQSKVEKGREYIWNGGGYLPHKPWLKWLQISDWHTFFQKFKRANH